MNHKIEGLTWFIKTYQIAGNPLFIDILLSFAFPESGLTSFNFEGLSDLDSVEKLFVQILNYYSFHVFG